MVKDVCRICLAEDIRMYSIVKLNLQDVYEKLCDKLLMPKTSPLLACYICTARLKNSQQLMIKCHKSQDILSHIIKGDQEHYRLYTGQLSNFKSLVISTVHQTDIVDLCTDGSLPTYESALITLKVERESDSPCNLEPSEDTSHVNTTNVNECKDGDAESVAFDDIQVKEEHEDIIDIPVNIPSAEIINKEHDQDLPQPKDDDDKAKSQASITKDTPNDTSQATVENIKKPVNKHTGGKSFICDICQKSFNQKKSLASHMLIHAVEKQFKCGICNKSFSQKSYLNAHLRRHARNNIYKCQNCPRTFSQLRSFTRHSCIHTGEKSFVCDICGKVFADSGTFSLHKCDQDLPQSKDDDDKSNPQTSNTKVALKDQIQASVETKNTLVNKDTDEKNITCKICQKSFKRNHALTRHMVTHAAEKPFKCTQCNKSFSQKDYLKVHSRIHAGIKIYKCQICPQSYSQIRSLTRHSLIHTGERSFKCDICEKEFTDCGTFSLHMCKHKMELEKSIERDIKLNGPKILHECDICHSKFKTKSKMNAHRRIHTDGKPFECHICHSKFRMKSQLKSHNRSTHTGAKPYVCDMCGKGFTCKSTLVPHIRTHTGDKPFKCDICKKRFIVLKVLRGHMRVHTGEKPFKCNSCDRSFRYKPNLVRHILIHTGERPYQCHLCPSSFRDIKVLKFLIRIHNGETPYKDLRRKVREK